MTFLRSLVFIFLGLATAAIPSRLVAQTCEDIFESPHFAATENYRVTILNGFRYSADSLKTYRESLETEFFQSLHTQNELPQGAPLVVGGIKIGRVAISKNPEINGDTYQALKKAFRIGSTTEDVTKALALASTDPYILWLKENSGRDPIGLLSILLYGNSQQTRLTPSLALMHLARLLDPNLSTKQLQLVDEAITMYKSELTLRIYGVGLFDQRENDAIRRKTWNLAPNFKQVRRNLESMLVQTAQPHMRKFPPNSYGAAAVMIASRDSRLSVLTEIGEIRLQRAVTNSEYADFAPRLQVLREALLLPPNFDLTLLFDAMNLIHRNVYHHDFGYEWFIIDTFDKKNPNHRTISELRLILELAQVPASQDAVRNFILKYQDRLRFMY